MKRILAIILITCIILPTFILTVPAFAAENGSEENSSAVADKNKTALSGGYLTLDGAHLIYENKLIANNDGTYLLTVTVSASRALEQINSDPHIANNGFYVVPSDGDYLVELWGAKGGDGADTPYGDGGDGGAGGYVYGVVSLKKGDILYYSLGGNGQESPAYGRGGGVNGPGGTHGDSGGTTVGGGGGYSALYLFDVASSEAQSFADKYTSDGEFKVDGIDESDRISQYVMIAGGGGGGGSGEGVTLLGSSGSGAAHGGKGGSIGSASGTLVGNEYDVEGTFFSGSDGRSSGSSTQYIGKGGSNTPGSAPKSMLSLFDGTLPNDWKGTYNTTYSGGAGGAGNLSGGGGGAGFCGGSGGVMAGLMTAGNIGGGGGGSSFVAKDFRFADLTLEEQSHLVGENPSTTGGAFAITPMGIDDLSYLEEGLTFSGTNTKYFYMKDISAKLGEADSGTIHANSDASLILVEDASVGIPTTPGEPGEPLVIDMLICPRRITGFAGGNGVPLIVDNAISCVAQTVGVDGDGERIVLEEHGGGSIEFGNDCSYVNVPYNLQVKTISHLTNEIGQSHPIEELYEDNYAGIRGNLASDWRYDYIESLGEYRVTDIYGEELEGDSVSPIVTTQYRVFFEVEPKNTPIAKVGTPVKATQIFDFATVTVIGSSSGLLHDNQVTYTKDLVYDEANGNYIFSLNVKSNSTGEIEMMPEDLFGDSSLAQVATYEIKYSGYYLIRAWGANGGEGGDSGWNSQGGAGGKGGFVGGYVYLERGTELHIVNGRNGEAGANGSGFLSWGGGGKGGQASYVYITNAQGNTEYLAIAGGGGGGGGYYLGAGAGGDATEVTTTVPNSLSGFNGEDGSSRLFDSSSGGDGGKSYLRTDIYTDTNVGVGLPTDMGRHNLEEALKTVHTNDGGGAVYVNCLEITETHTSAGESEIEEMQNYDFELYLSRYFKAIEIWGENADGNPFVFTDNSDGVYNEYQGSKIKFHDIVPSVKQTNHGDSSSYILSVDYTLYIRFDAREGFMGGNDVPLTEYDKGDFLIGMFLAQTIDVSVNGEEQTKEAKLLLKEHNATDYVNVEVDFLTDNSALTVYEKDYIVGYSDPIAKNDLFSIKDGAVPVIPDDWRTDFVQVVDPTSDEMLTPTATTEYVITLGVGPIAEAQRADTLPSVEGALVKKTAVIHVDYRVDYQLTGIKIPAAHTPTIDNEGSDNDIYAIEYNADYDYVLEAKSGYYLPDTITVIVGEHTLIEEHEYTYDPTTGALHIDWDIAVGRITVIAVGRTQKHKLHFVWEETPGGEAHTQVFEYESGSVIDTGFAEEKLATMAAVVGHTFRWDWGNGAEQAPDVMPAQDLWVTGFYAPNRYTLTINYYLINTHTELAPSQEIELFYGEYYMIESPAVAGHISDKAVVSGFMDQEGKTVDVYYTKVEGALNLVYIHTDTGHTETTESVMLEAGDTVEIIPPATEGHDPEYVKIVASMGNGGDISVKLYTTESEYTTVSGVAGMTLRIYYKHNTYRVIFDSNGGALGESERIVYFHHLYTYNGSSYDPLPTPVRVGHEFLGWYLGDTLITDETDVETARDHTLVARWKGTVFNITVEYKYEDGSEAHASASYDLEYGMHYDIITPELRGYTATETSVSGTVGAQNSVVVVVFNINEYTVTVYYLYSDDGSEAAPTYSQTYRHKESYSIASPDIDGMIPSIEVVNGTIDAAAVSITVYYDEEEPIISVSIVWGEMTFELERGEWQPDEHSYTEDTFTPSTEGANGVTVTNEQSSNVSIDAEISFVPSTDDGEVNAYFTASTAQAERLTTMNISKGESKTAYVYIVGRLPKDALGDYVCGVVTVTIRGGQK